MSEIELSSLLEAIKKKQQELDSMIKLFRIEQIKIINRAKK